MNEIITARNKETRKVGRYPRSLVEHEVLGKYLEEVPFGTKSFVDLDELVREKNDLPARFEDEFTETYTPEEEEN